MFNNCWQDDCFPQFTREEELELVYKMRKGCEESRASLICSVLPYALQVVNRIAGDVVGDDVKSLAGEAAILATDRFKPDKFGTRLTTYVSWWAKQTAIRARAESTLIRLPLYARSERPDKKFSKSVQEAKTRYANAAVLGSDFLITAKDIVGSDNPEASAAANDSKNDFAARLRAAMTYMPSNQVEVLLRRFYREETLTEVGYVLGVTRERVRQLQKAALRNLQDLLQQISFREGQDSSAKFSVLREQYLQNRKDVEANRDFYTQIEQMRPAAEYKPDTSVEAKMGRKPQSKGLAVLPEKTLCFRIIRALQRRDDKAVTSTEIGRMLTPAVTDTTVHSALKRYPDIFIREAGRPAKFRLAPAIDVDQLLKKAYAARQSRNLSLV